MRRGDLWRVVEEPERAADLCDGDAEGRRRRRGVDDKVGGGNGARARALVVFCQEVQQFVSLAPEEEVHRGVDVDVEDVRLHDGDLHDERVRVVLRHLPEPRLALPLVHFHARAAGQDDELAQRRHRGHDALELARADEGEERLRRALACCADVGLDDCPVARVAVADLEDEDAALVGPVLAKLRRHERADGDVGLAPRRPGRRAAVVAQIVGVVGPVHGAEVRGALAGRELEALHGAVARRRHELHLARRRARVHLAAEARVRQRGHGDVCSRRRQRRRIRAVVGLGLRLAGAAQVRLHQKCICVAVRRGDVAERDGRERRRAGDAGGRRAEGDDLRQLGFCVLRRRRVRDELGARRGEDEVAEARADGDLVVAAFLVAHRQQEAPEAPQRRKQDGMRVGAAAAGRRGELEKAGRAAVAEEPRRRGELEEDASAALDVVKGHEVAGVV
mmetsp:Transcript_8853/g.29229  ORF Transcript_8853/g.29229 Transcript_8853/m.29229 type:complete len:449 (-) Transcript_8853:222-1568(-)